MNCERVHIYTMYQSKTRRPWFQVLNVYSSLHIDARIKSKVCSEEFRKFSFWWALKFSKLDKGELRKWSLKNLTLALKTTHFTDFLFFPRWVSIFKSLFLLHFKTKIRSFCDHWKGNFLNFLKLILLFSLIYFWFTWWCVNTIPFFGVTLYLLTFLKQS